MHSIIVLTIICILYTRLVLKRDVKLKLTNLYTRESISVLFPSESL